MKEEAKRLHDDLMNSSELADALKDVLEHGTPEEQVKAANELGYKISLEDVLPPQMEELEDEELEAVSGGVDAANGHEVGCWRWWYENWEEANFKCCPKGNSDVGYDHDYEEIDRQAYWDTNKLREYDRAGMKDYFFKVYLKCKRCGYILYID